MTSHEGCRFVPGFSSSENPQPDYPTDQAAVNYWADHGSDKIPVMLIDLVSVIARLRQVRDDGMASHQVACNRLFTCDLPRLEGYLPGQAREAMDR